MKTKLKDTISRQEIVSALRNYSRSDLHALLNGTYYDVLGHGARKFLAERKLGVKYTEPVCNEIRLVAHCLYRD